MTTGVWQNLTLRRSAMTNVVCVQLYLAGRRDARLTQGRLRVYSFWRVPPGVALQRGSPSRHLGSPGDAFFHGFGHRKTIHV